MEEKTEISTLVWIRRIRDEQAEILAGKSPEEIISFFRQAATAARQTAGRVTIPQPDNTRPHVGLVGRNPTYGSCHS